MAWHPLATMALDVDTGIAPARAHAITEALCRRIVALLVKRDGRVEPLATGCLYWNDGRLVLVTCRHAFESGVALDDVHLPLGDSGRLLALRRLDARFVEHPERDLAAIALCPRRAREALHRHWFPVPLSLAHAPRKPPERLVIAGYPYAQMRRVDGTVYARPLVVFTRPLAADARVDAAKALGATGGESRRAADAPRSDASWHAHYARTARRIDGVLIHAPEMDGVSGATVWAIADERNDVDCVLLPAGVQCAFRHDTYVRGEPIHAAQDVLARLTRH